MSKIKKNEKKQVDALTYLKRLKGIGIFGIFFSVALIIYDAYMYENWMSVVSLVVDGLLFIFSIYFIVKSIKLTMKEKTAIEKSKTTKKTKTKK